VGWGYADPGELAAAQMVVADLDALLAALTDEDAAIWSASAPHRSGRAHP